MIEQTIDQDRTEPISAGDIEPHVAERAAFEDARRPPFFSTLGKRSIDEAAPAATAALQANDGVTTPGQCPRCHSRNCLVPDYDDASPVCMLCGYRPSGVDPGPGYENASDVRQSRKLSGFGSAMYAESSYLGVGRTHVA